MLTPPGTTAALGALDAYASSMAGRPLNGVELDAYDHIPRALAVRVRIHRVRALPGGYAGMTLGYRILLSRDERRDGSSALLAHELVHVRQWAERGLVGFSAGYLASFGRGLRHHRRWRPAYHDIEDEIDAREETARWLRRRLDHQASGGPGPASSGPV